MANEAASIAVRIGADLAPLQQGLAKGSDSVSAFSAKSVTQLRNVASQAVKVGAAATAAGAAILAGLYVKGSKAIDAQAKLARSMDGTIDGLRALTIAAENAGLSQQEMEGNLLRMNRRLGEMARTGGGPAAAALNRLGLSAQELLQLPLEQRVAVVSEEISKLGTGAEMASVAFSIFGDAGIKMVPMLKDGGAAIREAAEQVRAFGLSVSEVDAAKIEMANNAMSTIGMATDGLIQQFTVELAPIIKAVSDRFVDAAGAAGGFGGASTVALNNVVNAAGFVLDGFHGIEIAVDGAKVAVAGFVNYTAGVFADMVGFAVTLGDKLSSLAGFENNPFGAVRDGAAALSDAIEIGLANSLEDLRESLASPMPSEGLRQFVQDAKAAGQAAAEAAVKAREAAGGGTVATLDDARTDDEKKAIEKRLEAIRQANLSEIDLLKEKQAEEMALIAQARELGLETKATYDELERQADERHQQEMADARRRIAEQSNRWEDMNTKARLNTLKGYFGQASALMNSESRKMFEIGKAAAYAQAMINTFQGISEAWKLGPIIGPPMAALVALNGFAQVQNIRKQTFGQGGASPTGSTTGQVNAGNTPVNPAGNQSSRDVYVHMRGINPESFVRAGSLVDAINEELSDGARLRNVGFAA